MAMSVAYDHRILRGGAAGSLSGSEEYPLRETSIDDGNPHGPLCGSGNGRKVARRE